jgi:hypothetical protein
MEVKSSQEPNINAATESVGIFHSIIEKESSTFIIIIITIGSWLGGLFRAVFPLLKKGGVALTRELAKGAAGLVEDMDNNVDLKTALKSRGSEMATTLGKRAYAHMSGSGYIKGCAKRKKLQSASKPTKKRTIKRKTKKRTKKKTLKPKRKTIKKSFTSKTPRFFLDIVWPSSTSIQNLASMPLAIYSHCPPLKDPSRPATIRQVE